MNIFLISSFLTSISVASLLFSRPVRVRRQFLAARVMNEVGLSHRGLTVKLFTLLLFFLLLPTLMIIGFGLLHKGIHPIFSWSEYLIGSYFRHFVTGVLLGVILPFWVARIYHEDAAQKWPLSLYFFTAAVLIVFILGMGDAVLPLMDRVTSVPTPWGAITLTQQNAASLTGTPPPDRSQETTRAASDSLLAPRLYGLDTIAFLSSYIKRDSQYITSAHKSEDKTSSNEFIFNAFAALANCHGYLNSTVGQVGFIARENATLYPPVGQFIAALSRGLPPVAVDRAAQDVAQAYVAAGAKALTLAYNSSDTEVAAKGVEGACSGLRQMACAIPGLAKSAGDCARTCNDPLCDKAKPLVDLDIRDNFKDWGIQNSLADLIRSQLRTAACGAGAAKCPYLVVLFAALTSVAGEPWIGERKLVDWLTTNESEGPELNARNVRRLRLFSVAADLLDQSSDQTNGGNDLERKSVNENLKLVLSKELLKVLMGFSQTQEAMQVFKTGAAAGLDAEENDLAQSPVGDRACPNDDRLDEKIRIANVYISNALHYVDLLEQQPAHWAEHAIEAATIMRGMDLDLACMSAYSAKKLTQPADTKSLDQIAARTALTQAEIRRLESRRIVLDAETNDVIFNGAEKRAKLSLALQIIVTGEGLIKSSQEKVSQKLDDLADYSSSRTPPTDIDVNIVTTFKQFEAAKTDILARLKLIN